MSGKKKMNLLEWLEAFETKKASDDEQDAVELGFDTWRCDTTDRSLMSRIREMEPWVKQAIDSNKVDPEKHYIVFNNRISTFGAVYDGFTIRHIENDKGALSVTFDWFGKPNEIRELPSLLLVASNGAQARRYFRRK